MKTEFNPNWVLPSRILAIAPSDSAGLEPQACLLPEQDLDPTRPWLPSVEEAPWLSPKDRARLFARHGAAQ
jgi:hypothetical protein